MYIHIIVYPKVIDDGSPILLQCTAFGRKYHKLKREMPRTAKLLGTDR